MALRSVPRKKVSRLGKMMEKQVPLPAWWSGRRDSNPRQPAWKAGTLPAELLPHVCFAIDFTLNEDAKASRRVPAF